MHCVLWERRPKTTVVWYLDDEVEGVEEFLDPAETEDRAGELLVSFRSSITAPIRDPFWAESRAHPLGDRIRP